MIDDNDLSRLNYSFCKESSQRCSVAADKYRYRLYITKMK